MFVCVCACAFRLYITCYECKGGNYNRITDTARILLKMGYRMSGKRHFCIYLTMFQRFVYVVERDAIANTNIADLEYCMRESHGIYAGKYNTQGE